MYAGIDSVGSGESRDSDDLSCMRKSESDSEEE